MTPDTLRQGARLVRALVEGDESVRGPLSDWIEEHGLPDAAPENCSDEIDILRTAVAVAYARAEAPGHITPPPDVLRVVACCVMRGEFTPRWSIRIGAWPAWAWEGTTQTTT